MDTDKIAFLINPSSGTAVSQRKMADFAAYLSKNAPESLFMTQSPGEMREITQDLASKNFRAIFACGGDGTLNLVSEQLLLTETALGIVPFGSGNGFARHHNIPLQWQKAIRVIENPKMVYCDTGRINGIHFLNIAGVGFAAKISHAFKGTSKRGLSGYARTVLKNLKMEPFETKLSNENSSWEGNTWMVDFCNGSQWGNNFRIQPGARDDDGALNAVVFKKMNPLKLPALGFRFANNTVPQSNDVMSFSGSGFYMEFSGLKPLHVDGEAVAFIENAAEVQVVSKSLRLWTL